METRRYGRALKCVRTSSQAGPPRSGSRLCDQPRAEACGLRVDLARADIVERAAPPADAVRVDRAAEIDLRGIHPECSRWCSSIAGCQQTPRKSAMRKPKVNRDPFPHLSA